ncbi:MAG TPA: hypothetical protein PK992_05820, partial [Planctomycetaceae bacterium]|nr:hypothetical protein [Planctomycetaceae bacterium]
EDQRSRSLLDITPATENTLPSQSSSREGNYKSPERVQFPHSSHSRLTICRLSPRRYNPPLCTLAALHGRRS